MSTVNVEITELQTGMVKAQQSVEVPIDGLRVLAPEECAHVRVGASVTKNMGNYNSLKVEVTVQVPCHPTQVEAVTDLLKTFVGQQVRAMTTKKDGE